MKLVRKELIKLFDIAETFIVSKGTELSQKIRGESAIYLVRSGCIKLERETRNGTTLLHLAFENDVIGITSAFGNDETLCMVALQTSRISWVPLSVLKNELSRNKELTIEIMRYLSRQSDELEARMYNMHRKGVMRNFAGLILSLHERFNKFIIPDLLSTSDMANMIGTTTNYLYKAIQRLEDYGAVSFKERKLHVINKEQLRKICTDY